MFELILAIIIAISAYYLAEKDNKNSELYKLLHKK